MRGATRVLVLGAGGGRLDHALGNLLLLASERYASIELDAWIGDATVSVVRVRRRFSLRAGDVVSLFAVGGPAFGVTTHGLEYPLRHETLNPGSRAASAMWSSTGRSWSRSRTACCWQCNRPGQNDAMELNRWT